MVWLRTLWGPIFDSNLSTACDLLRWRLAGSAMCSVWSYRWGAQLKPWWVSSRNRSLACRHGLKWEKCQINSCHFPSINKVVLFVALAFQSSQGCALAAVPGEWPGSWGDARKIIYKKWEPTSNLLEGTQEKGIDPKFKQGWRMLKRENNTLVSFHWPWWMHTPQETMIYWLIYSRFGHFCGGGLWNRMGWTMEHGES